MSDDKEDSDFIWERKRRSRVHPQPLLANFPGEQAAFGQFMEIGDLILYGSNTLYFWKLVYVYMEFRELSYGNCST
jgi:hypothetical protein